MGTHRPLDASGQFRHAPQIDPQVGVTRTLDGGGPPRGSNNAPVSSQEFSCDRLPNPGTCAGYQGYSGRMIGHARLLLRTRGCHADIWFRLLAAERQGKRFGRSSTEYRTAVPTMIGPLIVGSAWMRRLERGRNLFGDVIVSYCPLRSRNHWRRRNPYAMRPTPMPMRSTASAEYSIVCPRCENENTPIVRRTGPRTNARKSKSLPRFVEGSTEIRDTFPIRGTSGIARTWGRVFARYR